MDQGLIDSSRTGKELAPDTGTGRPEGGFDAVEKPEEGESHDEKIAELRRIEEKRSEILRQNQEPAQILVQETRDVPTNSEPLSTEQGDASSSSLDTEDRLEKMLRAYNSDEPDPNGEKRAAIVALLIDLAEKTNFYDVVERAQNTGRSEIIDGFHDAWEMKLERMSKAEEHRS